MLRPSERDTGLVWSSNAISITCMKGMYPCITSVEASALLNRTSGGSSDSMFGRTNNLRRKTSSWILTPLAAAIHALT